MGAFAGGKLIWDGTQWVICNSDYADFHWISISEVKDFMESLGFNMVDNEPVIPLSFGWEEQGMSGQTYGVYELSQVDTVPMYAVRCDNIYGNTLLQAAQSLNFHATPCATIGIGPAGARWQFSTSTENDPTKPGYPRWKIRANPYALWDNGTWPTCGIGV